MSRASVELLEVLNAMVGRLQALEQKVTSSAERQGEIDERISEIESEVADARIEAARGGEQLKSLLGDLVFDDKAPPRTDGTPQFVSVRAAESTNGSTKTEPSQATRTHRARFAGLMMLVMLLLAGAGFGLGMNLAAGDPEVPRFTVPSSCRELGTLSAKTADLQASVRAEYGRLADAAARGDIGTEQMLPADKAMARLEENTSAFASGTAQCGADLSAFEATRR